jgi:Ras-related protein Rab-6A
MAKPSPRPPFKVVLLGEQNVGKTSLLMRFHLDTWDAMSYNTPGQTFVAHPVALAEEEVTLHVWDTPGQEKFAAQSTLCVRDAYCCVVVYDVALPESHDVVETLIKRYESTCILHRPFVVVVGNKIDLLAGDGQQHELEKLEEAQAGLRVKSFLASAKTGEGVPEIFDFVASELLVRADMDVTTEISNDLKLKEKKSGEKCC